MVTNTSRFQIGHVMTVEVRQKISAALKGRKLSAENRAKMEARPKVPRGGWHLSEEARANISRGHMGIVKSDETRRKLSAVNTGKHPTDVTKAKISATLKGRKCTDDRRAKLKATVADPCYKAKIGVTRKRLWDNPEYRAKMSVINKGRVMSEAAKRSISAALKGRILSTEAIRKTKILWSDPVYKDKRVRAMHLACHVRPNKPETSLLDLFTTTYPGEWKYVGDGSFILAGKNPDFVNVNGKKLLAELWGDYWHKGENPQDRIDLFKQYGFDTLIVWEREMKDKEKVLARIVVFVESYHK